MYNNNSYGNFICVFERTIVKLATNRQFTNSAGDWLFKKKKKRKKKDINIALSLGYPNSYFYNKRCNMLPKRLYLSVSSLYKVAFFCQCQRHSSCLRTWSIHRRKRQGSSWRNLQISHIGNFYPFL